MNILITVGTTAFDDLIRYVDNTISQNTSFSLVAQISANAIYQPVNLKYFDFSDSFQSFIDDADLIITHAGAGSVYSMLEQGKRLVVIPNLTRADTHQIELAKYVSDKNFATSCIKLEDLLDCIYKASTHKFNPYKCESFFAYDFIRDLLR